MNTIYILVVITHVFGGNNIFFQEFYSLNQCEKNAEYLYQQPGVKQAYCTKKAEG
jgi:hypothetical protein